MHAQIFEMNFLIFNFDCLFYENFEIRSHK